jgi:hypothetical protein
MRQPSIIPYLVLLLLAFSWCVNAGHASWERSRGIVNDTASSIDRRWLVIEPSAPALRLWEGGEIKYCFENAIAVSKLLYHLAAARDRWYSQGLPEDMFKMTEVSPTECQSNRANVLLIKYNTNGVLSTTPGIPALNPKFPKYEGPVMKLSDRTDVGMLDVEANFAHELGHAWGMLHEHQNAVFWSAPYAGSQSQIFRFNCEALKDYQQFMDKTPDANERRLLCVDRGFAEEKQFSAAEYLPILGGPRGPIIAIASDDDVDWDSIMLYPSGAGGTGPASPDNDQRANVLVRASDGLVVKRNLRPTTRDVTALKDLYARNPPLDRQPLPNEPAHPKHGRFLNLIRRNRCI